MEDDVALRINIAIVALALSTTSAQLNAAEPTNVSQSWRSATKARDIGGFALGMHIRDANKISPVENLGNDNFKTEKDGIAYDFGVTPLGRIYRISSEQPLGRFQIDRAFLASLTSKLAGKFGPVAPGVRETFDWELVENITRTSGQVLPFKTNWASAHVSGSSDGVTLYIKMLDFRYLWQDEGKLNRGSRDKAMSNITL